MEDYRKQLERMAAGSLPPTSPVDSSIPARDVMPAEERAMLERDPELAKLRTECIDRTMKFKYWGRAGGLWGWALLVVVAPFASLMGCGVAIVVGGFACAAVTSEQPHEIGKLNPPWERCMDHGTLPLALLVGVTMIPLTIAGHRKQEEERRDYRLRLESLSLKALRNQSWWSSRGSVIVSGSTRNTATGDSPAR